MDVPKCQRVTGRLPYVTWQKLKRDGVPMDQWSERALRAYKRWGEGRNPIGRAAPTKLDILKSI